MPQYRYKKKINNDNINNSMANNINSNSRNESNNKNNSNYNKGNRINSNESNSNSNNNNSSSKENNSSSNIISKIKNNINNNAKENNISSNGDNNITINKQKETRKTAFIIGGSMVKKIDDYLLTSPINHEYIVKVRPLLSAKTIDMLDYIKPTQGDFSPDVYLLHVGTNNLSSNKSPDNNTVIVSSIVPHDD